MTFVDEALQFGHLPDDFDRAAWIRVSEGIREYPEILTEIERDDPEVCDVLLATLEAMTVHSRLGEWRSPHPDVGGRPQQLLPGTEGSWSDRTDWFTWLLCGGRGSGKTRCGAEAVSDIVLGRTWTESPRVALVGQTLDDVRTTMVEQTLLAGVIPDAAVDQWNRGPCELWLKNGAYFKGYSSEANRRIRGGNFHLGWGDEIGTWKDADRAPGAIDSTLSNLKLAIRAHDNRTWEPKMIVTTTPRAVRSLRNMDTADPENPGFGLYDDPTTEVSNMSTLDNAANLPDDWLKQVIAPYEGTRLYDQEVLGKLINLAVGAQWTYELCERMKVIPTWPQLQAGGLKEVVIGVDPSVGAGTGGDECGIVVVGLGGDDRAYILEDGSIRGEPREWVKRIKELYYKWNVSYVSAEINNGYMLIQETMGRYAPNIPVQKVWAKKNKLLRSEPVALLSDQDRVRFAGDKFERLIMQMCTWVAGDSDSPDRLDAMVYGVLALIKVGGLDDLITVIRPGTR